MLNPVQLRTLQAVLAHGSFADAAGQLGYTASAVSQQMSALERATGLTLFERLPRSVHATSSAHYLVEERLLILPPGHAAHRPRRAVDLRELSDATWVTSPQAPSLVRLCASAGFEPRMAFSTNDFNTVCAFVQAGLGVTIMPELAFPPELELRPLRVVPKPAQRHILALYRHSNRNPALPAMIERLVVAADEFPRVVPADD